MTRKRCSLAELKFLSQLTTQESGQTVQHENVEPHSGTKLSECTLRKRELTINLTNPTMNHRAVAVNF